MWFLSHVKEYSAMSGRPQGTYMTFVLQKLWSNQRGLLVQKWAVKVAQRECSQKYCMAHQCVRRGQAEKISEWMIFEPILIAGYEIYQRSQQGEGP